PHGPRWCRPEGAMSRSSGPVPGPLSWDAQAATRLREQRVTLARTQQALASAARVSLTLVSQLEHGQRMFVSRGPLERIADVLGTTIVLLRDEAHSTGPQP